MSEQALEEEIQAKGLNAPRLTPQRIDEVIKEETYTTLPSGKVMVCELTLLNGFTVRGEAAVVSKENFNEEIGKKISRENARDKVWEVEGYLLQQRMWRGEINTFAEEQHKACREVVLAVCDALHISDPTNAVAHINQLKEKSR